MVEAALAVHDCNEKAAGDAAMEMACMVAFSEVVESCPFKAAEKACGFPSLEFEYFALNLAEAEVPEPTAYVNYLRGRE